MLVHVAAHALPDKAPCGPVWVNRVVSASSAVSLLHPQEPTSSVRSATSKNGQEQTSTALFDHLVPRALTLVRWLWYLTPIVANIFKQVPVQTGGIKRFTPRRENPLTREHLLRRLTAICLRCLQVDGEFDVVGCSTGMSEGFVPLKILSTIPAARRYLSTERSL
jgi:hypothetical protein